MKRLSVILISVLFLSVLFAGDVSRTAELEKMKENYEAQAAKLKEDYEKKLHHLSEKYVEELNKAKEYAEKKSLEDVLVWVGEEINRVCHDVDKNIVPDIKERLAKKVTLVNLNNDMTMKISLQYAVLDIAEQVGLIYDFSRSYNNTNPQCRMWVYPNIKDVPFEKAIKSLCDPLGVTWTIERDRVVLHLKGGRFVE